MRTDQLLNTLLEQVVSRLACSGKVSMVFGAGDLEDATSDALARLEAAGLIAPADAARAIICDGCDRGCLMPVQIGRADAGRSARASIICDKRSDIGVVPVALEGLVRWRCSLPGVAAVLARCLGTDRAPMKNRDGDVWCLGSLTTVAGGRVEVMFSRRIPVTVASADATLSPIWIVLEEAGEQPSHCGVAACRVLVFRNFELVARREGLASLPTAGLGRGKVVIEVSYENHEVWLIDRRSGTRVKLAKPRLGSVNDRAFTFLCRNAGRLWTRDELVASAGIRSLTSMHKIAENLGFTRELRTAFFQISKQAILLRLTLTDEELASLNLDAGRLLAAARRRPRSS
jgi:hypothetical protein